MNPALKFNLLRPQLALVVASKSNALGVESRGVNAANRAETMPNKGTKKAAKVKDPPLPATEAYEKWHATVHSPKTWRELEALGGVSHALFVIAKQVRNETARSACTLASELCDLANQAILNEPGFRVEHRAVAREIKALIQRLKTERARVQKETINARISRAIALLDDARATVVGGQDTELVCAGIASRAWQHGIQTTAIDWKKAVNDWNGYSRPNPNRRAKGNPSSNWHLVVFRLLNPQTPERQIRSKARNMRDEFNKSTNCGTPSPQ